LEPNIHLRLQAFPAQVIPAKTVYYTFPFCAGWKARQPVGAHSTSGNTNPTGAVNSSESEYGKSLPMKHMHFHFFAFVKGKLLER
jgi:hypothetical protein